MQDNYTLNEILITEANAQAVEKADAVGYALVDDTGNQKYRKKARTATDTSTHPTSTEAVKYEREVVDES